MTPNLGNKQLQYTHYPISHEVWSIRQLNSETFFLKNHTQIVLKKLFPDPFLKNQK